jgi:hypothetical protein
VLSFELAQLGLGLETVNVNRENAGWRASGKTDVVLRLVFPSLLDEFGAGRRVLAAVGCCRHFVLWPAGKDAKAFSGKR